MNEQTKVETLKPFTRFLMTIGELPTSYLMSMTYYEQIIWFTKYLQETVIPAINNNAQAVIEIQEFINNLDLQDEVDNKLDEMAESGELEEIMADYLNSKAIFGFDNVSSMKSATNLIDGSFAETLGYYSKTDKGGAKYKVRKITNADVVDEMTLIALNDESLVAELIVPTEINVIQLGAKNDGITNASSYFNKLFTLSASKFIIPTGTYLLNSSVVLNNVTNKSIENNGVLNFASTDTKGSSCIELRECENLIFTGFNINSTRNKTSYPPANHTRVTQYSSNRIGFHVLKCENIKIINSIFNNLEYDIKITKRTADPEETILNKNIIIDGVYSRNCSQPCYAQDIDGLYLNNCDIIAANDLGDGDHILYVGEYSKNIHYDNSIVKAGNEYYGVLFNIQDNLYNTDVAAPVDFYANNIICSGFELVGAKAITKCYLNNIKFDMIDLEDNTNQTVLGLIGNCYVEVNNSFLKTTKQVYNHYSGTPKIVIKNSELKGDTNRYLFTITTAGSGNILCKNCIIDSNKYIANIANNISNTKIIFEDCNINCTDVYALSNRKPDGNNIIRLLNCYFKNTYQSTSSIAFNGSGNDMTGFEFLNTFFYGFNSVASITTNCLSINSYLNNTLIEIS